MKRVVILIALGSQLACDEKASGYIDSAMDLEQRRLTAEAQVRTIKALFSPTDPAYVRCRASYENARAENRYAYLALANAIGQSKPIAVATMQMDLGGRFSEEFVALARQYVAEHERLNPVRGSLGLGQALRVVTTPIRSIARLKGNKDIRPLLDGIQTAVLWTPWEKL